MHIKTIFFDVDGTLYPERSGLWDAIGVRINRFMLERMGFDEEKAEILRKKYLATYGTTLRGLQAEHHIDAEDYLTYVHDVPLEEYISSDSVVRRMLQGLKQQKWIFSNSDRRHIQRVLKIIGVEDCFDGLIDIYTLNFLCKPVPESYRIAKEAAGVQNGDGILFLDDSVDNVRAAKEAGFITVLVSSKPGNGSAHYQIAEIHELREILPQLWEE